MVKLKSLKIDQATLLGLRLRGQQWVRHLPRLLLVQHRHAVDVVAVVMALALALYLVVVLLYLDPPGVTPVAQSVEELAVDRIDRLEYWIEVREAERAREFTHYDWY